MTAFFRKRQVFAFLLAVVLVLLYGQGLNYPLVFDDARLTENTIFGHYGSLFPLKERMLSYGTFVWVQELFGEGWWKQRVLNLLLHLGVTAAVYGVARALLLRTDFPADMRASDHFEASRETALMIGTALFALNPVAVYAVAYLMQRSILMATFFVALACLAFIQALVSGRRHWFAWSALAYVAAVFSKEYAVTAAALTVPLYVFICRPPLKRALWVTGLSVAVLLAAAVGVFAFRGEIVGVAFDKTATTYAAQLEQMRPGVSAYLWPLSVANEAARFFQYGVLWIFPNVSWMAIDLRPEFPLSVFSMPILLGWVGYGVVLIVAAWLVLRRSDALGLLGLLVLCPMLLFMTEFVTVWLQDPFVLYRSYLWAFMLPALLALPLVGFRPKWLYPLGVLAALLFGGLALERLYTMKDAMSVWADAVEKIDTKAPANAVGRWKPVLNLGSEYWLRGSYDTAYRYFAQSDALGAPWGNARFNMGVSLQSMGRHMQALADLDKAEALGFTEQALLGFHRGESLFALKRHAEALPQLEKGFDLPLNTRDGKMARLHHAEAAMALGRFDLAVADYKVLVAAMPADDRLLAALGIAYARQKDFSSALAVLNPPLARRPTAPLWYARAVVQHEAGDDVASARDLEQALRVEPSNMNYQVLRRVLEEGSRGARKPASP